MFEKLFEKLSDNLNILMSEAHITAEELARRTGVPASTIKKIRNRYNPNPTLSTLLPLADYFSVTLGQFVGTETMLESRLQDLYQTPVVAIKHLPTISWQEAIHWPQVKKRLYPTIASEFNYSDNAYALLVEEDHWENLPKDTALLVDPMLAFEHRDFVIAYKKDQSLPSVKQILQDEGQIYLKPMIQGYKITPLTEEYIILGVIVEYQKHLKEFPQKTEA